MTTTSAQKLLLNELEKGLLGISIPWGRLLCEASSYCLELKNHQTGIEIKIKGDFDTTFQIQWKNQITEQIKNSWNDT